MIPDGETRKIETFPVFCVTMVFSVFAYIWLLIILVVHSPNKVEVWEAALTLAFIPVVVFASWCVILSSDWSAAPSWGSDWLMMFQVRGAGSPGLAVLSGRPQQQGVT